MNFVYPFIHSKANDRELELSIASVRNNYQGEAKIIVIGDRPAFKVDVMIEQPRSGGAFRDQIQKLWTAVKSKDVEEQFVWMMDDIWFVNAVNEGDLRTLRHSGYRNNLDAWKPSNNWLKSKRRTMIELRHRGFEQYDYSNHCPQFLDKTNVREMFVEWDLMNNVWEWKTIYQNVYGQNRQSVWPFRWRWKGAKSADELKAGFESASIANCNSVGFDATADSVLSEMLELPAAKVNETKAIRISNRGRYRLGRENHKTKTIKPSWKQELADERNESNPCPGGHRGAMLEVVNNKTCGARSKNSEPIYQCNKLDKAVSINPYKSAQPEGCCKRCDVFWSDVHENDDVIAVTSLIPATNSAQTEALDNWKSRGLFIVAVQGAGELVECSTIYPQVDQWIELPEPKNPRISEMIRVANGDFPTRTLMLINSDIQIGIDKQLPSVSDNQLVACCRWDYHKIKNAKANKSGLDVFLMSPSVAKGIQDSPFRIGVPVWDYWLPEQARLNGADMRVDMRKIFFHRKHDKRWSKEDHAKMRDVLVDVLGERHYHNTRNLRKSFRKLEVSK